MTWKPVLECEYDDTTAGHVPSVGPVSDFMESTASPNAVIARLSRLYPLDESDRRAISHLARDKIQVAEGQRLLAEGQAQDSVGALLNGWACRCKDFRDGRRQIIALLTPGDLIGVHDAVASRKTDHSVRALTRLTVAWISRARLGQVLADHPGLAIAMRAAAAIEESILRAWLVNLGQRPAHERLAFLFCEMAERLADEAGPAESFELPLTQQTLAYTLGLTPVHVNRVLQRLRSDGLVEFHDGRLTIRDATRTRALAGFDNAYLAA